jgi:hypothetical protein
VWKQRRIPKWRKVPGWGSGFFDEYKPSYEGEPPPSDSHEFAEGYYVGPHGELYVTKRSRQLSQLEGAQRRRGRSRTKELTTSERHQLRIARDNFRNPAKARFLGGPSPSESREIIKRLTGVDPGPVSEDPRLPGYRRSKHGGRTADRAARRRGVR